MPHSNPFLHGYDNTDLTLIPFDDIENIGRGPVWFFVSFLRGEAMEWAVDMFNFGPTEFEIPWDVLEKKPSRR